MPSFPIIRHATFAAFCIAATIMLLTVLVVFYIPYFDHKHEMSMVTSYKQGTHLEILTTKSHLHISHDFYPFMSKSVSKPRFKTGTYDYDDIDPTPIIYIKSPANGYPLMADIVVPHWVLATIITICSTTCALFGYRKTKTPPLRQLHTMRKQPSQGTTRFCSH